MAKKTSRITIKKANSKRTVKRTVKKAVKGIAKKKKKVTRKIAKRTVAPVETKKLYSPPPKKFEYGGTSPEPPVR